MRLIKNKLRLNKQYYALLGTFEFTKMYPYNRIDPDPIWCSISVLKSKIEDFDTVCQVFENLLLNVCFNIYDNITLDYLILRDEK
jgi:hypothetical protein